MGDITFYRALGTTYIPENLPPNVCYIVMGANKYLHCLHSPADANDVSVSVASVC